MYSHDHNITNKQIKERAEGFIKDFSRLRSKAVVSEMSTEIGIDPRNQLDLAAYVTAYEFLSRVGEDTGCSVSDDDVVKVGSPKYEGYAGAAFMASQKSKECALRFVRERFGGEAAAELEEALEGDEQ